MILPAEFQPFSIAKIIFPQQPGFHRQIYYSVKVHASEEVIRCVTAPVSVDSGLMALKYLHQPSNFVLSILILTGNV